MVDALFDLENVLRSQPEKVTIQEKSFMKALRARAQAFFYAGLGGGSAVTWLATKRLPKGIRSSLTLGAGATCGVCLCVMSLEKSVEDSLSLEGSRIQREMANILLKKYRHDNPWVRRLVTKHFYPEEVYLDSSADKPVYRWRYRNFSGEPVTRSQSTTSYGEEETNSNEKKIENTPTLKPGQQVSANATATATADAGTEDPFDLVLGVSESASDDDPQAANTLLEPSRRMARKEKRSRRRRRRLHRHEESEDE